MIPRIQEGKWISPSQFAAFAGADTDAHRLFSGPAGWVERLGSDVLISHKSDAARDELASGLSAWGAAAGWMPGRVFAKFLPRQNEDRDAPVLLSGDPSLPLTAVVREAGVRYGLDFGTGYSAGLFLDQRANRARMRQIAPKRLLNTFAYTGSFSVVAALAGGATVSVDLSKKSLDRARANFALNAIDPGEGHRFIADDVIDVLPRLARRGDKFDAIVLDPPTFSRGNKGRRWRVEDHFEDLLLAAMEVASPGANILLSTNCTRLESGDLERMARFASKFTRRPAEYLRGAPLVDFPPGHGARTLWMILRG
jgi:23S rRNA (cytosine1962-C5)-methyltransferase